MKGFDEIQQLWQGNGPEPTVSFETILKRIKSDEAAISRKFTWQIIAVGGVLLIMLWMFLAVEFSTWTTYLAIAIVLGCICYYFINQLAHLSKIRKSHQLLSKPQDYISQLKAFQQKRYRFNTQTYTVYAGCIAVAFALFSIELYFVFPLWGFVAFIAFVVFWFAVCHFFFMKRYVNIENNHIQQMINDLERISNQFREV